MKITNFLAVLMSERSGFILETINVRWALREYLTGKQDLYEIEYRLRHNDGTYRWVLSRGESLKNGQGKPYRMAGSNTDITERKKAEEELRHQQEMADRLLLNVLPGSIAERLKYKQETIADDFSEATVLFADIVGFTELANDLPPPQLVALLNRIFSAFDQLAGKHEVEKIKTIGDAYMVAGGIPIPRPDHVEAVAAMALKMQKFTQQFSSSVGKALDIRIGIHTGPVVAGIFGTKKFAYDLWGDTVNIASRMESHGIAGAIQVTEEVYQRLASKYLFQKRGAIQIKGRGEIAAYLLSSRLNEYQ